MTTYLPYLIPARSPFKAGDRLLTFRAQKSMAINPAFDPEGNEIADQIMKDRSSVARLRSLLNGMTYA
jgi:hypothetical protein